MRNSIHMNYRLISGGLSVLAMLAIGVGGVVVTPQGPYFPVAFAQDTHDTHEDEAHEGGKGQGGSGGHEEGDDSDHAGGPGAKKYQYGGGEAGAGPRGDGEGQGPRAGNAGEAAGGRPVWAQGGIPEVELGRLNVVRSPERVLDRAYVEAIATLALDPEMSSFYSQSYGAIVTDLGTNFRELSFIDSPLQNLSMLRASLEGSLSMPGVTNDMQTLQAVFLGVASDKTIPITSDTVVAVTTILGTPVTGAEAAALAAKAEEVRAAILAGHG